MELDENIRGDKETEMKSSKRKLGKFGKICIAGLAGLATLVGATNYDCVASFGFGRNDFLEKCRNTEFVLQYVPLWTVRKYTGEIELGFHWRGSAPIGHAHYAYIRRDEDSSLGMKFTTKQRYRGNIFLFDIDK